MATHEDPRKISDLLGPELQASVRSILRFSMENQALLMSEISLHFPNHLYLNMTIVYNE